MMNKIDHVIKAKQTRPHICHWPGCNKQVPPAMWGCKYHWFKLPANLRRKIWATYRAGQEEDLRVSQAYIKAAEEIQAWIRKYIEHEIARSGR